MSKLFEVVTCPKERVRLAERFEHMERIARQAMDSELSTPESRETLLKIASNYADWVRELRDE